MGCPFHRKGSCSQRVARFIIGFVVLGLVCMSCVAITAHILLNLAYNPTTGEVNPPPPYVAILLLFAVFTIEIVGLVLVVRGIRYLCRSSDSSSNTDGNDSRAPHYNEDSTSNRNLYTYVPPVIRERLGYVYNNFVGRAEVATGPYEPLRGNEQDVEMYVPSAPTVLASVHNPKPTNRFNGGSGVVYVPLPATARPVTTVNLL
jgi:hypothetical protein